MTSTASQQATSLMEDFRTQMRAAGHGTPAVEKFIDEMVLLLSVCPSPTSAMDALFQTLAEYRSNNPDVTTPAGAPA